MSIAKVIEVSSSSPKSIDDAVQSGLLKVATTVKNLKGAWVNEIKVVTDGEGRVTEWRVNMRVNFVVE
jgi:dodecin